ncbi:protein rhomboid isoform X2 [Vespula maculifrons]|uniref:rhomboid protease n=1 Tax=Vespula maculifrons TaxID=7453 RepID=A0ABD2CLC3_VESMC
MQTCLSGSVDRSPPLNRRLLHAGMRKLGKPSQEENEVIMEIISKEMSSKRVDNKYVSFVSTNEVHAFRRATYVLYLEIQKRWLLVPKETVWEEKERGESSRAGVTTRVLLQNIVYRSLENIDSRIDTRYFCTRHSENEDASSREIVTFESRISVLSRTLCFFTYYTVIKGEVNPSGPVPIDSVFIYRPDKRLELWRFAFYMFLHAGWLHLLFNLGVQVIVGLPLEMVHGSLRIAAVYMAGVLAGSLGTSVFDAEVYLVGASGGVYALLAAHLANVLLNYNNMEFGIVRLIGIFVIASADVGFAIYDRYAAGEIYAGLPVSYVAHLTGALAGLTIGLLVLKNFEQRLHEQLLWWVALGVYAACTIFAVMYNLMHPNHP